MLEAVVCLVLLLVLWRWPWAFAGLPQVGESKRREVLAWQRLLMFKGKGGGGSAPAPDKNIGIAALKEAETGQDWLNFAREQFAQGNVRQAAIDNLSNQVTQAQLQSMRDSNARSTDQWNRYKAVYQPVEDSYIKDATNWGSAERENKMAAEAKGDVLTNAAQQKQASQRSQAAMGVTPNSGRFDATERAGDLNTALAAAGAQNQARDQVRTQALALKEGVANMGRGATSTSAQQLGLGLQSGTSAMGTTLGANGAWQGNNQIMNQGFSGAMQGYGNQANILNSQYGNQLSAWSAQKQADGASSAGLMSGLGSLVGSGAALYALSSPDAKDNQRPLEDGALEAINSMDVKRWNYKPEVVTAGQGESGERIGPMADDWQQATGTGDGQKINMQDEIGLLMKGMQELNAKIDNAKPVKGQSSAKQRRHAMAGGLAA